MKTQRQLRWLIGFAILALNAASFADTIEVSGRTMGPIRYRVAIHDFPAALSEESVAEAIQAELNRVNQLMSTYLEDSDVSRFNRAEAHQWVEVDPKTVLVVERSNAISRLTGGAFDITVGPAVNLWNFGPGKGEFRVPADADVQRALALIGFQKVETRRQPPALRKTAEGLQIDLSAIAKGYAVDQVAERLVELEILNFLVEVGGEVRCAGQGPKGLWRIGIEVPNDSRQDYRDIVEFSDASVATSGDYRNFNIVDGVRYSHTIDPRTGRPVEHQLASASVFSDDCMTADALATAIMVLGEERGHEIADQVGFQLQTTSRVDGQLKSRRTPSFPLSSAKSAEPADSEKQVADDNGQSIWPAFLGALIVFGVAILGMAVGAIFNNKPVQGSCGGLSASAGDSCTVCSKPVVECPEKSGTA